MVDPLIDDLGKRSTRTKIIVEVPLCLYQDTPLVDKPNFDIVDWLVDLAPDHRGHAGAVLVATETNRDPAQAVARQVRG
ncbi:hypothetical protein GCM10009827_016130 [Dactylosporangium maewongense]|uniref:Uncharacterized protein n=1 Tax=Dactylosporangium maewongense TaxID=634393 RepID=A0ABN1ZSU0_9ACTN